MLNTTWKHREWQGNERTLHGGLECPSLSRTNTDRAGHFLMDMAARLGLWQVVKDPTIRKNILDLILTNLPAADASQYQ